MSVLLKDIEVLHDAIFVTKIVLSVFYHKIRWENPWYVDRIDAFLVGWVSKIIFALVCQFPTVIKLFADLRFFFTIRVLFPFAIIFVCIDSKLKKFSRVVFFFQIQDTVLTDVL